MTSGVYLRTVKKNLIFKGETEMLSFRIHSLWHSECNSNYSVSTSYLWEAAEATICVEYFLHYCSALHHVFKFLYSDQSNGSTLMLYYSLLYLSIRSHYCSSCKSSPWITKSVMLNEMSSFSHSVASHFVLIAEAQMNHSTDISLMEDR